MNIIIFAFLKNETMEENGNIQQQTKAKNVNLWLYIVLFIFALGIIGLSIWLISVKNDMRSLLAEKEQQKIELEHELDSLMQEHEKIKQEYGILADSLTAKDSIIQENAKEIKKLLNTKWEYYKIKKKLARLQVISQGYIRQMDSLYTVNHQLTEENFKIKEEIKAEKRKNKELEKLKEHLNSKVKEAEVLSTYNYNVGGIHVAGGRREKRTDKIRRLDKIKVCFTIGKNSVVKPGTKTLYIRIARPDKKILAKGRTDEYSFMYRGEKLQYSIMKQIDYQNEPMDICVYWNRRKTQEMMPGLYHVDIFEGDNTIGHATFTLR